MIYKLTEEEVQEYQKAIEECEEIRRKALAISDSHDLALIGSHISLMKTKLQSSYSESTPLYEVQSMIKKEIKPIHDKAVNISKELCRIYKNSESDYDCSSCPLFSDGYGCNEDELKKYLVFQYLTTEFHV